MIAVQKKQPLCTHQASYGVLGCCKLFPSIRDAINHPIKISLLRSQTMLCTAGMAILGVGAARFSTRSSYIDCAIRLREFESTAR